MFLSRHITEMKRKLIDYKPWFRVENWLVENVK